MDTSQIYLRFVLSDREVGGDHTFDLVVRVPVVFRELLWDAHRSLILRPTIPECQTANLDSFQLAQFAASMSIHAH